jgi:hypothetical protein
LLEQQLVVAAPTVAEVQIEVRTGSTVRPDALMSYGVPELSGELVVEWTFDVLDQTYSAFQENLIAAERVLGTAVAAGADPGIMPAGVKYLGTYSVLSGGASDAGQYRTLWGFNNFSAFESFRDKQRDVASQFAQALRLLTSCHDRSARAPFKVNIYQRAVGLRGSWDVPTAGRREARKKRSAGTRTGRT